MRILFLTHRLPFTPNRGDRIRAYHLVRALSRRHDVHIVSLLHDREEREQLGRMNDLAASVRGVRTSRLRSFARGIAALPTPRPLTHAMLDGAAMPAVIAERVASIRPDIVLAYCSGMVRHALEPPLSALPCVLDMVDVDSQKWSDLARTAAPPLKWTYAREARVLRQFEKDAVTRVAATIVVSDREREVAERVLGTTPTVIGNGVDLERFRRPGPPTPSRDVVFCGVFNYRPNEDGAVWLAQEVWPLVRRDVPDAVLKLVGMLPSRKVRALEIGGSVEVTGAVPDVRPYLWNGAVSAAPLHLARGVQNKVLEAIAAGVPCVVTPAVFEGLPSAVRPAVISSPDAVGFADSLVTALRRTPTERAAIAARADLRACSWEVQLQPFETILDDVLAGGQRRLRRAL